MLYQNIPPIPAFPVPVQPQSFDTSLSYYELLCKLTEAVNTCIERTNTLVTLISGWNDRIAAVEAQVQTIGDVDAKIATAVAAEAAIRQQQIDSLSGDLANFKNIVIMNYATYDDIEHDYIINATVQAISQADYDELETPVANRIYAVMGDSSTTLYFNGAPLMSAAAGNIELNMRGSRAFLFGDLET